MLHLKDILKSLFFQLLERDLRIKNKTGFTTQCPVYNRLYSHLQLRIKGWFQGRVFCKIFVCIIMGVSCLSFKWCSRSTECQPFEFVSCLNQSALIKYVICHIFTVCWLASLLAITGIKCKSLTICTVRPSWFIIWS